MSTLASSARAFLRRHQAEVWAMKLCRDRGVRLDTILAGELRGPGRERERMARHEMRSVLRDTLGLSLHEMGRGLGVDHTSIISSCQVWERERAKTIGTATHREKA